tara:strand:- start:489 stop:911 length:423 start_codon:yes stop_codon:yes gene_type:complete
MAIKDNYFGISSLKDITVKIPLDINSNKVGYETLDEEEITEVIKFNLKSILLTHKGERMDTNFGVGIKNYLFEQSNDNLYSVVRSSISSQVRTYMPWLTNVNIRVFGEEEGNRLSVVIKYKLNNPEIVDYFELSISVDEL